MQRGEIWLKLSSLISLFMLWISFSSYYLLQQTLKVIHFNSFQIFYFILYTILCSILMILFYSLLFITAISAYFPVKRKSTYYNYWHSIIERNSRFAYQSCKTDSDCPKKYCRHPERAKCMYQTICKCVGLEFIEN
jgi:hypothetical protein